MADCKHLQWAREEDSCIVQAFQVRQCGPNYPVLRHSNACNLTVSITVIHAVLLLLCCQLWLSLTYTSCMMHGAVVCKHSVEL